MTPMGELHDAITDVAGLAVGHFTHPQRATGCTVVLCPQGVVAGVDVRGGAPGTRETDLLRPENLVDRVHAVLLTGGSAFGLDAAAGVMRWLEEHGHGFAVGTVRVSIVPAAVLFVLWHGDPRIRPDAADLSLARGLDYYTGPIFETTVSEPRIGSISGGGRYDNLIGMFDTTPLPATGSSFGLERVLTVMEELELASADGATTEVLVSIFSPDTEHESLRLLSLLRAAGIRAEAYLKHDKMKKQLAYASGKHIPLVAILGPDEARQGTVMLRNLIKGDQKAVLRNELNTSIRDELKGLCSTKAL